MNITYMAPWNGGNGFAAAAENLAGVLQGNEVVVAKVRSAAQVKTQPRVAIHQGFIGTLTPLLGSYNIAVVPWETDRIPASPPDYAYAQRLNRFDELWCPSAFSAQVAVASGVSKPCKVIPHVVDMEVFAPPAAAVSGKTVRFGYVGSWDERKNPAMVLEAYLSEFGVAEDVSLTLALDAKSVRRRAGIAAAVAGILKGSGKGGLPAYTISYGPRGVAALRGLYGGLSAFVTAAHGEGFGLCAVEAMACGVPLIAAPWSAMADYLDATTGYPLAYAVRPSDGRKLWRVGGQNWAFPDMASLRTALRQVAQDRVGARERGAAARALVQRKFSADVVGPLAMARLRAVGA
jgi:glycosyltransferase involved in cell wall biosynthesis